MGISREDLLARSREIDAEIQQAQEYVEHLEEEKKLIQLMLERPIIRFVKEEAEPESSGNGHKESTAQVVRTVATQMGSGKFRSNDVIDAVIKRGLRSESDRDRLRPTVAEILLKLHQKGILDREQYTEGHISGFYYWLSEQN